MGNVYISHPLRGAEPYTRERCRENIDRVTQICLAVTRDFITATPISPVHAFSFLDPLECDEGLIMTYCNSLLLSCDELWVFGDWETSNGCLSEIEQFTRCGKGRIVFRNFCTETGKITKQARFSLAYDIDDFVAYLIAAHKKRREK